MPQPGAVLELSPADGSANLAAAGSRRPKASPADGSANLAAAGSRRPKASPADGSANLAAAGPYHLALEAWRARYLPSPDRSIRPRAVGSLTIRPAVS